ncbi:MAG: rhomboid family protein [Firmicutes bacterium]|nr:rhomboid family protein [Bacillota bacterium]
MFPIRDNIPSRSTPFVMYGIILFNACIFYNELVVSDAELEKMVGFFGLIPFEFMQGLSANPVNIFVYVPLITNLFLHGGWLHIIGNMWYLKIFGDNIEDRMGHGMFFLFYILCGVVANIVQIIVDPASQIPTIGASGAISGVLGAYSVCFPSAKVSTVVFLFIFLTVIEIPALLFLGLWFFMQLQSGAASLFMAGSNVAWWAHIGGFLAGMALVNLFPKRQSY